MVTMNIVYTVLKLGAAISSVSVLSARIMLIHTKLIFGRNNLSATKILFPVILKFSDSSVLFGGFGVFPQLTIGLESFGGFPQLTIGLEGFGVFRCFNVNSYPVAKGN